MKWHKKHHYIYVEKDKQNTQTSNFGENLSLLEKLIETLGFAHGALDVERAYVLPVLLQ